MLRVSRAPRAEYVVFSEQCSVRAFDIWLLRQPIFVRHGGLRLTSGLAWACLRLSFQVSGLSPQPVSVYDSGSDSANSG